MKFFNNLRVKGLFSLRRNAVPTASNPNEGYIYIDADNSLKYRDEDDNIFTLNDNSGGGGGNSGNTTVDIFYYQVSNSVDTRPVFTDNYVTINWDETANDLEFVMDVAPTGGSNGLRSIAAPSFGGGTSQSTFITTVGLVYDLYSAGVSAGDIVKFWISPEDDINYPYYEIEVFNTGESYKNSIKITRTVQN